jgi:hypothetical protein
MDRQKGATLFLIQERMISLWKRIATRKGFLDMISFGPIQNQRAITLKYFIPSNSMMKRVKKWSHNHLASKIKAMIFFKGSSTIVLNKISDFSWLIN